MPPFLKAAYSLIALTTFGQALPAMAASDIYVSKTTDSRNISCGSGCSLREAIMQANNAPGPNRIILATGTYRLTLAPALDSNGQSIDEEQSLDGDFDVRDELTIIGSSTGVTVIDGTSTDRIFEVAAGTKLTLKQVTLRNGKTEFYGAGIENHGETSLSKVRLEHNNASSMTNGPGAGGGIANYGVLSVYKTVLLENIAEPGSGHKGYGGGIYNSGTLTVRDSTFNGNMSFDRYDTGLGGGLYNIGTANIGRSTFTENFAIASGGAIGNDGNGVLTMSNSTISHNYTGDGSGGGVVSNGQGYPAVQGSPSMLLVNVTLTNNIGFALNNVANLRVRNSIVAGNWDEWREIGFNCRNIGPNARYQAVGLLLGTGTGNCTADLYVENEQALSTVFSSLASNGGSTQTHALRSGSPALDSGIGSCTSHDQRGVSRPRDGNGDGVLVCDLGAYERAKP